MTDFTIITIPKPQTIQNLLTEHLSKLPSDMATVGLVAALFKRYATKNNTAAFRLRPLDVRLDPHGLLVGFNHIIAIFWRSSCGYFWILRKQISFEHEAAFIEGSHAPIIDKPRINTCYRFRKGILVTVAIPFKPCALISEYKRVVVAGMTPKKSEAEDSDDDAATAYRPNDGFTLFGDHKP